MSPTTTTTNSNNSLSNDILKHVWSFLELRDVPRIATLCRGFSHSIQTNDEFWKRVALNYGGKALEDQYVFLSGSIGWKDLLQRRVDDRCDASWRTKPSRERASKKSKLEHQPVDPEGKCKDISKQKHYGFYIETEGKVSNQESIGSFFVEDCKFHSNNDDGNFVLHLDVPNFFEPSTSSKQTFAPYFDDPKGDYCENTRYYRVFPNIVRIYITHKETGKQADLFDASSGTLWLYPNFESYNGETILPMVVEAAEPDASAALLHIYNKCEDMDMDGSCTQGIALFRGSGTTTLKIRILVEHSKSSAAKFFGEQLRFRL